MSNGNLNEQTKKYIDLEVENKVNSILQKERLTRDGVKSSFFEYMQQMPSDSNFIKALVIEICDRITFREEVADLLGDRVRQMVDEHDIMCKYKDEHDKYHKENESSWGIMKKIKDNLFSILWRLFLIVAFIVSFLLPDKAFQFLKELITKLFK